MCHSYGKKVAVTNNEQLRAYFEKVRSGDKKAFEEIYNDMKTPVFTIIWRIVQQIELSEDLMHDLFVKLYQSPPDPSVENPVLGYSRLHTTSL